MNGEYSNEIEKYTNLIKYSQECMKGYGDLNKLIKNLGTARKKEKGTFSWENEKNKVKALYEKISNNTDGIYKEIEIDIKNLRNERMMSIDNYKPDEIKDLAQNFKVLEEFMKKYSVECKKVKDSYEKAQKCKKDTQKNEFLSKAEKHIIEGDPFEIIENIPSVYSYKTANNLIDNIDDCLNK